MLAKGFPAAAKSATVLVQELVVDEQQVSVVVEQEVAMAAIKASKQNCFANMPRKLAVGATGFKPFGDPAGFRPTWMCARIAKLHA